MVEYWNYEILNKNQICLSFESINEFPHHSIILLFQQFIFPLFLYEITMEKLIRKST